MVPVIVFHNLEVIIQGVSHWNVSFEMSLTDRSMQVKLCLKVVLECWDWIFLGLTTSFCEMLTIGPNVNHPQFHLVFAQFHLIFAWFLFDSEPVYTTVNDSWLHYSDMLFSFAFILKVFAAPLRSELSTYFQKPCKNQTSCWHYQVSCLSK